MVHVPNPSDNILHASVIYYASVHGPIKWQITMSISKRELQVYPHLFKLFLLPENNFERTVFSFQNYQLAALMNLTQNEF